MVLIWDKKYTCAERSFICIYDHVVFFGRNSQGHPFPINSTFYKIAQPPCTIPCATVDILDLTCGDTRKIYLRFCQKQKHEVEDCQKVHLKCLNLKTLQTELLKSVNILFSVRSYNLHFIHKYHQINSCNKVIL